METYPPAPSPTAGRAVTAHWAFRSKRAGHVMDYEVLASSEDREGAEALIRRGLTGTPDGPALGKPDELPWFTFTGGTSARALASVAVVTWSSDRDGTGQAVAPTWLLYLPWADAAAGHVTYEGLRSAALSLARQPDDAPPTAVRSGTPLRVTMPALDAAAVTAVIERLGLPWVAAIAAILLDGDQVVITAPPDRFPSVEQRVACFDAIIALLPYGCRAAMSAATWASPRVEHSVHLTFSTRARRDQREMPWQQRDATATPRQASSLEYLHALRILREKGFSVGQIVAHLSSCEDPGACRDPRHLRDFLEQLDLPNQLYREILDGRGDVRRVGWMLRNYQWRSVSEPMRRAFFLFLADQVLAAGSIGADARQILQDHWSSEVTGYLAEAAGCRLSPDTLELLRVWLTLAAAVQSRAPGAAGDVFLGALDLSGDPPPKSALQAAVQLLLQPPANVDPNRTEVTQLLLNRPRLAIELLTALLDSSTPDSSAKLRQVLDRWVRQTASGSPHWLRPILAAAGASPDTIDPADVKTLAQACPDAWRLLLNLAWTHSTVELVFEGSWPWYASLAAEARLWTREEAWNFDSALGTPQTLTSDENRGRFDLIHLARRGFMPYLSMTGAEPTQVYLNGMSEAWHSPELAPLRAELGIRLVNALLRGEMAADRIGRLMKLVDALDASLRDVAAAAIAPHLEQNWALYREIQFNDVWTDAISNQGGTRWLRSLRTLANRSRAGESAERIAEAYGAALSKQASTAGVIDAVSPWITQHATTPEQVVRLVRLLLSAEHATDLLRAVLSGRFDGHLAQTLPSYVRDEQRWNAWFDQTIRKIEWEMTSPPRHQRQPPSPWQMPTREDSGSDQPAAAGTASPGLLDRVMSIFHQDDPK